MSFFAVMGGVILLVMVIMAIIWLLAEYGRIVTLIVAFVFSVYCVAKFVHELVDPPPPINSSEPGKD